jgi:hypothetical protein
VDQRNLFGTVQDDILKVHRAGHMPYITARFVRIAQDHLRLGWPRVAERNTISIGGCPSRSWIDSCAREMAFYLYQCHLHASGCTDGWRTIDNSSAALVLRIPFVISSRNRQISGCAPPLLPSDARPFQGAGEIRVLALRTVASSA